MQPYLFPYIGYFQLINAVDRWIVFDDVQYIDKGWINRNRILHPDIAKEWQFISIPLAKRGQFDRIRGISVKTDIDWRSKILGKLSHYKKKAPYYSETLAFVRDCLDTDETNVSRLVTEILKKTTTQLSIDTPVEVQSDMQLQLGDVTHPGQWALRISEALGASGYINPLGGAKLFNHEEYAEAKIGLSFLKTDLEPYSQRRNGFVSGLSIIDVLMFNSPADYSNLLSQHSIVRYGHSAEDEGLQNV